MRQPARTVATHQARTDPDPTSAERAATTDLPTSEDVVEPVSGIMPPAVMGQLPTAQRAAALLAIQRAAGNRAVQHFLQRVPNRLIQRADPADRRLPADRPEALALAGQAKAEIDQALAALAASSDPERRNTSAFIAQHHLVPMSLTPRHDSPTGAPRIHFFPGQSNYSGSFTASQELLYRVSPRRTSLWVRARQHDDVDAPLAQGTIEERLAAAVSEIAHTKAERPGQARTFDLYRSRFNALFDLPPFNALPTEFDRELNSRGPRTRRARAVFERIMTNEAAILAAYEGNTGGIRERIDAYSGPDGMNQINSPRVQALRAAFFPFPAPVPSSHYPAFKAAVQQKAADLDDTDREAIDRSNDWQRLINAQVTTDDRRTEIRAIIANRAGGSSWVDKLGGLVTGTIDMMAFLASWQAAVDFGTGSKFDEFAPGANVRYRHGGQQLMAKARLPEGQSNAGLVLFVRGQVLRGGALAIPEAKTTPFPARGNGVKIYLPVNAPAIVPPGGDVLTVRIEILAHDGTTPLDSKEVALTVQADQPYTQQQAEAAAAADERYMNDPSPAGLLGKMLASPNLLIRNAAESIHGGAIRLRPMTARHDSAAFVATVANGRDPSKRGWFVGDSYGPAPDAGRSHVESATSNGMTFRLGDVVHKRTFDVAAGAAGKLPDDKVIAGIVHEAIHALDAPYWQPGYRPIDSYKVEFRALWMDGRYGPPDQTTCPPSADGCRSAAFDPAMAPPGPKSPRARAIFDIYYNRNDSFRQNYDDNVDGFRDEVDRYLAPDGINLIASIRLEALRRVIAGWNGTNFPAFHAAMLAEVATLMPADRREISGNRAWRDLVERQVRYLPRQIQVMTELGIPR